LLRDQIAAERRDFSLRFEMTAGAGSVGLCPTGNNEISHCRLNMTNACHIHNVEIDIGKGGKGINEMTGGKMQAGS